MKKFKKMLKNKNFYIGLLTLLVAILNFHIMDFKIINIVFGVLPFVIASILFIYTSYK